MHKKTVFTLTLIFLFFFLLNYLYPLSFGDDYVYSFVWQGHLMEIPISEGAVRVSSWRDLFISQWSHYFTWGGRFIGLSLAQFFLWLGKDIFNFINAFISVLLIAEIYWCSNRGEVTLNFEFGRVCWIFFAIWAFVPNFGDVFLWLTGSCVYLWPMVFLLGFLLPYLKKYYNYHNEIGTSCIFSIGMFFLGIISGCGNENCICWIILILLWFLFRSNKRHGKEIWMHTGVTGLILGYCLLLFSPGSKVRLYTEYGFPWFHIGALKDHFYVLAIVLTFQLVLWHFSLRSLYKIDNADLNKSIMQSKAEQDIALVKLVCIVAFGMSAVMILSPSFPLRSGFPGTVQLVLVTAILMRFQTEYGIELIKLEARKFLLGAGSLYFIMTASITIQHSYNIKMQMDNLISTVKQVQKISADTSLTVRPFKGSGLLKDILSGYHLTYFRLADDENSWGNVAFARYYDIKGIRMADDKNDSEDVNTNN